MAGTHCDAAHRDADNQGYKAGLRACEREYPPERRLPVTMHSGYMPFLDSLTVAGAAPDLLSKEAHRFPV